MTAQEREVLRLLCSAVVELNETQYTGLATSSEDKLRAFAESEQPAKELPSVEEIVRQMTDAVVKSPWVDPEGVINVCARVAHRMMAGMEKPK